MSNCFQAEAVINNRVITLYCEEEQSSSWSIVFYERKLRSNGTKANSVTFQKTGHGGEITVYGFIAQAMNEFISRHKPEIMTFSASSLDGNRGSLYRRAVSRMFPAYHLDISQSTSEEFFTLTRK
jgi:hypothetical protein